MENRQMLEEFLELVQIPVHSRSERQIADAVKAKLEALGLEVTEDDTGSKIGGNAGNIRAVLKGNADCEPLLFSAHMDRVANNGAIKPIVDEEKQIVHTDGSTILAADDVAGICIILDALRRLKASDKPHGDIEVALSVCEEMGILGGRHFDFSKFRAKSGFVFDAEGDIGGVMIQAPAKCSYCYKIHGKASHAGEAPEKGINAIRAAAGLILAIPDNRQSENSTANIAAVHAGGPALNIVCDYAEVNGEMRSTDAGEFEALLKKYTDAVPVIEKEYGVKIEYSSDVLYKAFSLKEDGRPAALTAEALRKCGVEPRFEKSGGGMDANHFNANGIETVGITVGYFNCHTGEEYLKLQDFYQCGEMAAQIAWLAAEK